MKQVDVACVGSPFLDFIVHGLPGLPAPGEELLGDRLTVVPGGIANVAYALVKLGLSAVVCAPVGTDPAGRLLRELMDEAGVPWIGRQTDATSVTVAMPAQADRAFVTVEGRHELDCMLDEVRPRAVVAGLEDIHLLDTDAWLYAGMGDQESRRWGERPSPSLHRIRALIVNEREAQFMTGHADPGQALRALVDLGTTVVITRGRQGAIALDPGGMPVEVVAPPLEVSDPTGAGDAFFAAYVWADLNGDCLHCRVSKAVTYASLSLSCAHGTQKGMPLADFEAMLRH